MPKKQPEVYRHKLRSVGPYDRCTIGEIDGRTHEGMLVNRIRRELSEHCGNQPNAVQRVLIERAAMLSLRVAQIDAKIMSGADLTLHDSNYAIAWNNALRLTLTALGVEPTPPPRPTLADILRKERDAA